MWLSPVQLHIPDGFLNIKVALVGWILASLIIAIAIRQTRNQLGERQIPLMGVMAAFIFASQAINFPVAAGTSGHLLGGALAAITLGPWAATLLMTAVIVTQGLLFQDGGLLVMGWNILNMGVFTAFAGYAGYALMQRLFDGNERTRLPSAFVGAWFSMQVGAIATAFELALSGTSPLNIALPAMAAVHAIIGIGEGFITAGAVALLQTIRPEVLNAGEHAPGRRTAMFVVGSLVVIVAVILLSPIASPHPDGFEVVAQAIGFSEQAIDPLFNIMPDYRVSFLSDQVLATIVAIAIGTMLVFFIGWLVGRTKSRGEVVGD
jgi:cobalt/nickel transport system permease protein